MIYKLVTLCFVKRSSSRLFLKIEYDNVSFTRIRIIDRLIADAMITMLCSASLFPCQSLVISEIQS